MATNDLYAFVSALDPLPIPGSDAADRLSARCRDLQARMQGLKASFAEHRERLAASIERVAGNLRALAGHLPSPPDRKALRDARARLMDSYEALMVSVRAATLASETDALPGSLRPRNLARNLFHLLNAVVGVVLYQWVLSRTGCLIVLGTILGVYATLDITRRIFPRWNEILFDKVLRPITRPRERFQIPSATWYAAATFLVVAVFDQTVAQVAVLVLGFGDPAAALMGRRFGHVKLWRRKSVVGTTTFFVVSFAVVAFFLAVCKPLGFGAVIGIAALAAATGAAAELASDDRIDDNFTIPVAVALVLALAFAL